MLRHFLARVRTRLKYLFSSVAPGFIFLCGFASLPAEAGRYDVSQDHPYGLPNPAAAAEISDFAFIIGQNDCVESKRDLKTGGWTQRNRTWDAHYVLNGYGIYDSSSSARSSDKRLNRNPDKSLDTGSTGNMRVFNRATGLWHVTFFAAPTYSSGTWTGSKQGEDIVLQKPQTATANNLPGFSTLTFSNISDKGFSWHGAWASEDGTINYPFWTISCQKRISPEKG